MVISCLLSNWNRKIRHEQIHHNGWNKCRSCCWGRTEQQFSFKCCHQYRAVQVLQGGSWEILQWAVVGYLSLSVGECSCSRQMMVMLVLLKIVSPHCGQLSCSLCLDVQWLLVMLCDRLLAKTFQQGSGGRVRGDGTNKRLHTTSCRKSRALLLCFQKPKLLVVEQQRLVTRRAYVDLRGWERGKTVLVTIREMANKLLWQRCRAAVFSPRHWLWETLTFFAVEVWLPWQPVFSWISALVESPSVPATSLFWNNCFTEKYLTGAFPELDCCGIQALLLVPGVCLMMKWWWYGEFCGWIEKVLIYLLHEVSYCHGRERCYCWLLNPGIALKDKLLACPEFAENFVHCGLQFSITPPAGRLNWSSSVWDG